MKIPTPGPFARYLLAVFCLLVAGCSSPRADRAPAEVIPRGWKPYLLYLEPSPHPRLYVELDAVEGCAPNDAAVKKLRDFLTKYCHKPGGIEIVRGAVIARSAARGIGPEALARHYMIGPPQGSATNSPAFMCMLFYDGALAGESAAKETPHRRRPQPNPRTDILPYPVVYMNVRYGPQSFRKVALLHETGHMLGLAHRTNGAAGFHCLSPTCLMNRAIHLSRFYLGMQRSLCKQCVAELAADSKLPPPNLQFVGPVLVRAENGYSVLSLPGRVELVVGDVTGQDCQTFAAAVQAEKFSPSNNVPVAWLVKDEARRDPSRMREVINRIEADDFYDPVGFAASEASWSSRGVERYFGDDPAPKIIEHCRKNILAHPQDGWNYNELGWLKATSRDASVRDGKEALNAATKACELSDWKSWNWIDTLAAAYAESGDFKRAIATEEKAMHTGTPGYSGLQEMQGRMSLYKRSKPYRE